MIADEIVRTHPADAWPIIQAAIESQADGVYDIVMWLGDSSLATGKVLRPKEYKRSGAPAKVIERMIAAKGL